MELRIVVVILNDFLCKKAQCDCLGWNVLHDKGKAEKNRTQQIFPVDQWVKNQNTLRVATIVRLPDDKRNVVLQNVVLQNEEASRFL